MPKTVSTKARRVASRAATARKERRPVDQLNAHLAKRIAADIARRGITQTEAAHVMHDAASQISLVCGGHLRGFSTIRLLRMLNRLGYDTRVTVHKTTRKYGRLAAG